jgi:hypothetical protein
VTSLQTDEVTEIPFRGNSASVPNGHLSDSPIFYDHVVCLSLSVSELAIYQQMIKESDSQLPTSR